MFGYLKKKLGSRGALALAALTLALAVAVPAFAQEAGRYFSWIGVSGNANIDGNLTVTGTTTQTGAQTFSGNVTLGNAAADTVTVTGTVQGATPLVFEGATANAYELSFAVTDPTAARTVTWPDATGVPILSVAIPGAAHSINGGNSFLQFEGTTADAYETSLIATDPTADRLAVFPDASGVFLFAADLPGAATAITGIANGFEFEGATADGFETSVTVTDPGADNAIVFPNASGTVVLTGTAKTLMFSAIHGLDATGADYVVDVSGFVTLPQSKTDKDWGIPIDIPVGYTVTGFYAVGQIDSAGNTASMDLTLYSTTYPSSGNTSTNRGSTNTLSVTADTAVSSANLAHTLVTPYVITGSESLILYVRCTTGATTDIELGAIGVLVTTN